MAANEAHAAKDRALADVSGLKLLAEKEHAGFDEEWRQLTRLIEDDRQARQLWRQRQPQSKPVALRALCQRRQRACGADSLLR